MVTKEQVMQALRKVIDPELHRDLVDAEMIREVQVQGNRVHVTVALTVPTCPLQSQIKADVIKHIKALEDGLQVEVTLTGMNDEEKARLQQKLRGGQPKQETMPAATLNRIKTVIVVMSGKGGVGKSTVAAMLAIGLRQRDLRVGVLDADITGSSIPKLFGAYEAPLMSPLGIMPPTTPGGIKLMSLNLMLQREEDAVIWRGPLITGAIKQFWNDVFWGDLDVLVVDTPPGTSDAALTVMQNLPITGIVLVTSPQDLAEMVVRKAANMAQQMNVPLIGVVENMSYMVCTKCGHSFEVFGKGKTESLAQRYETRFLGKLAIDPEISRLGDRGQLETYHSKDFDPLLDVVADIIASAPDPHPHQH